MVFVVHYLDVKFKVDRGSAKRQQTQDKKKDKAKTRETVLCSFSYSTLVQVTNGFLDQVIEYVRKEHPLALPACETSKKTFLVSKFCMSKINKIQNNPEIHMF